MKLLVAEIIGGLIIAAFLILVMFAMAYSVKYDQTFSKECESKNGIVIKSSHSSHQFCIKKESIIIKE